MHSGCSSSYLFARAWRRRALLHHQWALPATSPQANAPVSGREHHAADAQDQEGLAKGSENISVSNKYVL